MDLALCCIWRKGKMSGPSAEITIEGKSTQRKPPKHGASCPRLPALSWGSEMICGSPCGQALIGQTAEMNVDRHTPMHEFVERGMHK